MAVSSRFDSVLQGLSRAFRSYLRAPRSPDSVGELASERAQLEDARLAMGVARNQEGVSGVRHRMSPKWVEPGRRTLTRIERWFAFLAIGLFLTILIGGVFLGVYAFRSANRIDDVGLRRGSLQESLNETVPGSCVWSVSFELVTKSSLGVGFEDVSIVVSSTGVGVESFARLRDSSPVSTLGQVSHEFESCPASLDDIDHSGLIVRYTTVGSRVVQTKSLGL